MSKGSSIAINSTVKMFVAIAVGVVILLIILPLILGMQGMDTCAGPYRGIASVMSDMTGISMC